MRPDTVLGTHISVIDGWKSDGLRGSRAWRFTFERDALEEVQTHLRATALRKGSSVHRSHFPKLGPLAGACVDELASGRGIVWIRSGSADMLRADEWRSVFSVFCSLLGMTHRVVDTGEPDPALAPAIATAMVDGMVPDVVGAVRLSPAQDGHEILLASATAVHDEIKEHDLDLARALYRTVLHDPDASPSESRSWAPVFHYAKSARSLQFRYDRAQIEWAHRRSDIPLRDPLPASFDLLDKTLTLPHLLASVRPEFGDIVLVNNRRTPTVGLLNGLPPGVDQQARAMRLPNPNASAATAH